jgi:uncharacterized membrane protein
MNLLDFEFIVVLNLFVGLLWPASGPYRSVSSGAIAIIMIILTIIAIVLDIVFLVLRVVH